MRVEGVGEKIICTGLGCVTENEEGNCHYSEGGEGGKLANFTFGCSFGHFFWQICYFHDRISSFASMWPEGRRIVAGVLFLLLLHIPIIFI